MAERDKPTDENFLGRWSRLKRRRETEPRPRRGGGAAPRLGETGAPEPTVTPEGTESVPEQVVAADPPDSKMSAAGEPVAAEDLPDVDSLDAESDYTGFLKPGVPEILRRKALRTLWRSNPVFANLDGLNDYDEDFSAVGIVAQEVSSLYKVGKGIVDPEAEEDAEPQPQREEQGSTDRAIAANTDSADAEATELAAPSESGDGNPDPSETDEDPETQDA